MANDQSADALSVESLAWDAYLFGRDLLNAVRETLEAARDVKNMFGSSRPQDVADLAARSLLLIQSREGTLKSLVSASGWGDHPAIIVDYADLNDVPEIVFAANNLKDATENAAEWLRSLVTLGDVHGGRRDEFPDVTVFADFEWHLARAVERLGEFRPVRARVVEQRVARIAGQGAPDPVVDVAPDGDQCQTETISENQPSGSHGEDESKSPHEPAASNARGQFVYDCRQQGPQVSWDSMEEVVVAAGYGRAGRTKLQNEMRQYCEEAGLQVPKASTGRPRVPRDQAK